MPIPTRSKSVATASKAPSEASQQHERTHPATHVDATADPLLQSRPSTLPQPQRQTSTVSHNRSHSTTAPSARKTHQRPGSISGTLLQHGSQASSLSQVRSSSHVSSSNESASRSLKGLQKVGLPRPAFSTYQQHFSPQKAQLRPQLHPTKTNSLGQNAVAPKEGWYVWRLQDELLQLSLVHMSSERTLYDFERSVNEKLALAAHELNEEREEVFALETEYQKSVNALALFNWLQDVNPQLKESKVQDLGFCIRELTELSGDGCLFEQLMTEFGQWLENAQKMLTMLSKDTTSLESDNDNDSVLFLSPPGVSWWQRIDECSTRLAFCQNLLTGLGEAEPYTGIGIVLSRHQQLTAVMLDKIHTAQDIINAVTASQEQFRSQALNAVLNDAAAEDPNDDRNGIWSMLGRGSCIIQSAVKR